MDFSGPAIISGYKNGTKFRPSAWAEMLSGAGAIFDRRTKLLKYAWYLRPIYHSQHGHCLFVDFDALREYNNAVFELVEWFIKSNQLEVVDAT